MSGLSQAHFKALAEHGTHFGEAPCKTKLRSTPTVRLASHSEPKPSSMPNVNPAKIQPLGKAKKKSM